VGGRQPHPSRVKQQRGVSPRQQRAPRGRSKAVRETPLGADHAEIREYALSLAALLNEHVQRLCDEVPGFQETFSIAGVLKSPAEFWKKGATISFAAAGSDNTRDTCARYSSGGRGAIHGPDGQGSPLPRPMGGGSSD
jgi:hypothetical protein